MILSDLSDFERYVGVHPDFALVLSELKKLYNAEFNGGKILLRGEDLFINMVEIDGKGMNAQKLEVHERYIDIHMLISGEEAIGISMASDVAEWDGAYDEALDCRLSSATPASWINMHPGQLLVAFPKDAHAPAVSDTIIRKAIAKIKL